MSPLEIYVYLLACIEKGNASQYLGDWVRFKRRNRIISYLLGMLDQSTISQYAPRSSRESGGYMGENVAR